MRLCRSILDLRDLGFLSRHRGEPVYIPQWKGEPFVPLQTTVSQRSVLPRLSYHQLLVGSDRAESCSSLLNSNDSCGSHLPVCLAGPSLFMGFPDLASRGWEADWRLLLSGDDVCLWILALHLHSHLGESVKLKSNLLKLTLPKTSFVISFSAGSMDNSVWMVALDADCNRHPDLRLSIGAHLLAHCPRRHQGGGHGYACDHRGSAHAAGYRLQGWWGSSTGYLVPADHKLNSKLSCSFSAVLLPDSSLRTGTGSHIPPSSHNIDDQTPLTTGRAHIQGSPH